LGVAPPKPGSFDLPPLVEFRSGATQKLLEALSDAVFIVDVDGKILFANRWAGDLTGYPREELAGMSVEDLIPEARRAGHAGQRADYMATPSIRPMGHGRDLECRRRGGESVPVNVSLSLVVTEEGPAVLAAVRDVSVQREMRREMQRDLLEAEGRFRRLFENVVEGIFLTTFEGRYVAANPALAGMLGYASPQELIEQVPDVQDLYVDPATRERFMEQVKIEGKVVGFEYEVRRKDGTTIWVSENTSMMYDEEGIPVGFEGTSMDVTARRAAESSGQDRAEQLRQADLKRRALLGKLFRVQQEERRRISSDLHADTIQQMTVASLRLEVLRQKAEGAPEVQAGLADLEVLVSQVIARLRRLAFDLRPPQLDEVGLAAAISETAATTEGSLQVRVQDDLQASVPLEVRSNAFSIISEALTNARKHSGATSALVQLSTRGEGMLAKVIDEGAGFSPGGNDLSDQWHLGMSDMHERAEMGGGWLRVESAPGQGSAVEFFLPFPAAADAGTTATEG